MPIRQFSLESLKQLDDGKPMLAFERHLARIAPDCLDRPADSKERSVNLKLACKPVMQDDGDCTEVKMQIFVTSSIPTHKTKVYSCGLRKNGVLVWNEDSPENIDQTTFLKDDEED